MSCTEAALCAGRRGREGEGAEGQEQYPGAWGHLPVPGPFTPFPTGLSPSPPPIDVPWLRACSGEVKRAVS